VAANDIEINVSVHDDTAGAFAAIYSRAQALKAALDKVDLTISPAVAAPSSGGLASSPNAASTTRDLRWVLGQMRQGGGAHQDLLLAIRQVNADLSRTPASQGGTEAAGAASVAAAVAAATAQSAPPPMQDSLSSPQSLAALVASYLAPRMAPAAAPSYAQGSLAALMASHLGRPIASAAAPTVIAVPSPAAVVRDWSAGADAIKAAIADVQARAAALGAMSPTVRLGVDDKAAMAELAALRVQLAALRSAGDTSGLTGLADQLASVGAAAGAQQVKLSALRTELGALKSALTATTAAAAPQATALSTLAYGWGTATGKLQLFGGAAAALKIPLLGSVGAAHLLVDSVVELATTLIPATIALGAFGIAAVPTVQSIVGQMKALHTTSTALGQSIYPLTGGFSKLADAVKPEVYQLFGQMLEIAGHKTGEFASIAEGAGKVVDQLGARFTAAVTAGGGFGGFLSKAVSDLAGFGTFVFNIFGALGNLFKHMPGVAQALLGVLDGLSGALEKITASPIAQWAAGALLAIHGWGVWIGVGVTLVTMLGNALVGLAAKLGLATAGSLAFDAAQFGGGIKAMISGVGLLAKELFTLGAGEDIAAAGALTMEGAMTALGAINPLIWVGAAVGALGYLIYELAKSTTYVDAYRASVQNAFAALPVSQVAVDLTIAQADAVNRLAQAQAKLATFNQGQVVAAYKAIFDSGHTAWAAGQQATESQVQLAQAYLNASVQLHEYGVQLSVITPDQKSYAELLRVTGGNLSLLTDAGITWSQWVSSSGSARQQMIIQITAMKDAYLALALGTGRAAAANNAQTNSYLTDSLPAMQQVTKAEDALMTAVLGGEQAFIGFQQGIQQTAKDAAVAGASLGGLNAQSLTLGNDFYSTMIPAAVKLNDALQAQMITGKSLTTVIADETRQMLPFTRGNLAAKSVLVDLVNSALGPGTVSLKTLRQWVDANSGSMRGFTSIVAQTTVNAGNLAKSLSGLLNVQFENDLLAGTGADAAMKQYTYDLTHQGVTISATRTARQALIIDLENAGFSAQQATAKVDGLTSSLARVPHHVNATVTVNDASLAAALGIAQSLLGVLGQIGAASGTGSPGGAGPGTPGHRTGGLPRAGAVTAMHHAHASSAGMSPWPQQTLTISHEIVLQPQGHMTGLEQMFIEWLRGAIKHRGGQGKNSVQVALGQTW
jgi:hypothetical protein